MSYYFERDRIQCQAVTNKGQRGHMVATHSDGGKAYCERHVQIARRDRANAVPLKLEKK